MGSANLNTESLRGASTLVTGGLGFIGSNLARTLAAHGSDVTVLDSAAPHTGANWANLEGMHDRINVALGDVCDRNVLTQNVIGKSIIFNLAAQTSHMGSMMDPRRDLAVNASAQLELVEACRHHNPTARIVYASTRQVYGVPDSLPVTESHPLRPVDVNGINKISGEFYHTLYSRVYGIRSTVLRLTNTYGPRMRIVDATQMFLGAWIRSTLLGEPFELWAPDQQRDFAFVEDVVNAFIAAAISEATIGKIYNVGGSGPFTLRTVADLLLECSGRGSYVLKDFPEERKKIDVGSYYANDEMLQRDTGWAASTTLTTGLRTTLDYYRDRLGEYIDESTFSVRRPAS